MPSETRIDPRLRVLYLAALAVGVFLVKPLWALSALALSQALAWLLVGIPARRLLRQVTKLWGFALFIVTSYALTADDPATDRWVPVSLVVTSISVNVIGALTGAAMIVRVLTVVMASQVARAGDSRAIAQGLGKLGVPKVVAASIDAVLALFGGADGRGRGGGGGGGGRGTGGGGGRHRGGEGGTDDGAPHESFWAGVKRIGRGDVGPIVRRIEQQIARAEAHVAADPSLDGRSREYVRDVAVIAGVSLSMLGIKALKVLPSIPFAPGHKLVVLTPLYVVAALLTKRRFGATLTGLTMGTVAFLMGDGRYGIFEIVKHVTPGLATDLMLPFLVRQGPDGVRMPGPFGWSVVGGIIGAARFATIFTITLMVQAPAVAYGFLIPGFVIHTTFGTLSGFVTHHIVRALERVRTEVAAERAREEEAQRATPQENS